MAPLLLLSDFKGEDGLVVVDPFLDGDDAIFCRAVADDDVFDSGVDDLPLAHGAGGRIRQQLVRLRLPADEIERRPEHVLARGRDDGVRFSVDAAAELIALAGRNVQRLPHAEVQIRAVLPPARSPIISRGNNLVIPDDDGPVFSPQAGAALQDRIGDVKVIIDLVLASIHVVSPFI